MENGENEKVYTDVVYVNKLENINQVNEREVSGGNASEGVKYTANLDYEYSKAGDVENKQYNVQQAEIHSTYIRVNMPVINAGNQYSPTEELEMFVICGIFYPILSAKSATGVLVANIFFPGFGTMLVGCIGAKNCGVWFGFGFLQFILAGFIFGWIWSIVISCKLITLAEKFEEGVYENNFEAIRGNIEASNGEGFQTLLLSQGQGPAANATIEFSPNQGQGQ